ncbi:hypothetical protein EVA_17747, partial [gut metagenome]
MLCRNNRQMFVNKNFKEVALGYTKEMAVDEAQR